MVEAVFRSEPGSLPLEKATTWTPLVEVLPSSLSIWSSGMSGETVASPESVKVRCVGTEKTRSMATSGSERVGYGLVRHLVIR